MKFYLVENIVLRTRWLTTRQVTAWQTNLSLLFYLSPGSKRNARLLVAISLTFWVISAIISQHIYFAKIWIIFKYEEKIPVAFIHFFGVADFKARQRRPTPCFYRVCHGFRLTMWVAYFWVNFDPIWSKHRFLMQLGDAAPPLGNLAYPNQWNAMPSISSTLNVRIFHTNVVSAAFF